MKLIDKETLIETFQFFDREIVIEIIDIFIKEQPERMAKIREAVSKLDFDTIKFEAHSLKGVIANFVAEKPFEIAKALENKGTEKDDSDLGDLLEQLEQSTADLLDDLKLLRKDYEN